jgi:hypothetical protein
MAVAFRTPGAAIKTESRHSLALQYLSEGPISDIVENSAGWEQSRRPPEGRDCRTEPLRALEVDYEIDFFDCSTVFQRSATQRPPLGLERSCFVKTIANAIQRLDPVEFLVAFRELFT